MNKFWQEYDDLIDRLNIGQHNIRGNSKPLTSSRGQDESDRFFDFVEVRVEHSPLCEGKVNGRSCRTAIIDRNIASVYYLCKICKYSIKKCADKLNEYRKLQAERKSFEFRPISINAIQRIENEIEGRRDITCSTCGRKNNVKKIRAWSKLNHDLMVTYDLIHNRGVANEEIATVLDITPSAVTQRTHRLDELIPGWLSAKYPKSKIFKKPDGKPLTILKQKTILQTSEQLEFAAEPPPKTKAQEKKKDEKRIETQGDNHAAATAQKHLNPPAYQKSLREDKELEKKIKKSEEDVESKNTENLANNEDS